MLDVVASGQMKRVERTFIPLSGTHWKAELFYARPGPSYRRGAGEGLAGFCKEQLDTYSGRSVPFRRPKDDTLGTSTPLSCGRRS